MKPTTRRLGLLLAALLLLWAAAPAWGAPFSFVAIADSQGNGHEPINGAVFSRIVQKILSLYPRPAFVLVAGDMVRGGAERHLSREVSLTRELRAWQAASEPLRAAGIRLYCVPGNHEIWGTYAAERERACRAVLGELQYAFAHQGSWFIGLNTDRPGKRRTPDLAWLGGQLAAAKRAGAQHVFVFGHEPAFPVTTASEGLRGAEGLWEQLVRHGADAYICGHEHLYARTRRGGVYQVTTGGAGGSLLPIWGAEGFEVAVGTHHLTVWRVDGARVEMRALAFNPSQDSWCQIDSFAYTRESAPRRAAPAPRPASAAKAALRP